MYRIGQSSDLHVLVEGRDLILGGVKIDYKYGLLGHSDADCLLHVVAESILGALAKGDLGTHFPDNDQSIKGIDSSTIVKDVVEMMTKDGYKVSNIDTLIIIQNPKMKPYISAMKKNIATLLNINENEVNVKATTSEKVGIVGEEKAVVCQAVVLLNKLN